MRSILGGYLGCLPDAVPIDAEYGQRPRVPGLQVSLAHGDGLGLVAVAVDAIGVDVEALDAADDPDLVDVAAATLSARELQEFVAIPASGRAQSWLRSWVRKEAVLKARGEGLSDRLLSDVDVSHAQLGDLTIVDVAVGPGYLGTVAVSHPAPRVLVKDWVDEPF